MSDGGRVPERPQQGQRRAYQPPPGAAKPADYKPPSARQPGPPKAPGPATGAGTPRVAPPDKAGGEWAQAKTGVRGEGAFEFSFEQDEMLKDLARNIRTVSWVLLLLGIALGARHLMPFFQTVRAGAWRAAVEPLAALLGAGIMLYSFFGLRMAGGAFADIVESQAQDVPLLVQALRSLNRVFAALALLVIIIGGLVIVATVIYVMSGGLASPK